MRQDPDPDTRAELIELEERAGAGDVDALFELESAFSAELTFGTAGLRGRTGPGPNRMNELVVRRTTAGLATYLSAIGGTKVVIGFDGRRKSRAFALASAEVLAGYGLDAVVISRPIPTPVVAFAIRRLSCDAGIVVTASHNPAADNGFKVYLGDGVQIVPPADSDISTNIRAVSSIDTNDIPAADTWTYADDSIINDYVATAARLATPGTTQKMRVVYTPLHGVGREVFESVISVAGFAAPVVVASQAEPNPDFPTVQFPNPEEPGCLDLAFDLAKEVDADLVIAHDPDADRCAVAVPTIEDSGTSWRRLTGDQVGALLTWWIIVGRSSLTTIPSSGDTPTPCVVAQSVVSGSLAESIARRAGCTCVRTLTGFKWIGRVPGLTFGYEEAIGYCVDPVHVSDKDGITAALLILEMASHLSRESRTLDDVLDDIERLHGVHLTDQLSVRLPPTVPLSGILDRLKVSLPSSFAGLPVRHAEDLSIGTDDLPPTDCLIVTLEDGCRVIVRPSGTEPKLKFYFQVTAGASPSLTEARASARVRLGLLLSAAQAWLDSAGT